MKKLISTILILGLSIPTLTFAPKTVEAATTTIRQEINITDSYLYAGSGATATSSAIANLDSTRYSGATYYFEVVASTTAGTNATVLLKNATSSVTIATANITGGNVYTRYRSSSFTAPGVATDYVVTLGEESIGKGIIASRIVILQSADPLSNTQTQIEIGTAATGLNSTTTSALPLTKYWKYDSTKWDPAPSFSAEVTYNTSELIASSTVYNTSGTRTYIVSPNTKYAVIEAWGGGGGGGVISNAGGGGGGGGAYARSTTSPTVGSSHTLVVGIGGTIDNGAAGTNSTYDTTTVVAAFGAGTNGNAGALGGTVANSTGDVEFKGGDGKNGETTIDLGGGGGGAAGPNGAGKDGVAASATVPGAGGDGNNSIGGGTGGPGGTTNTDTCATSDGTSGTSAATGGGGGGGAGSDGTGTCTGGNGGVPGGGGGGSDGGATRQAGANGQIKITEWGGYVGIALEESDGTGDGFTGWTFKTMIVNQGRATTTPVRVRSSAFTPVTGRNYRLVASTTQSNLTYSIHNAKIVADQTSSTETTIALDTTLQNQTTAATLSFSFTTTGTNRILFAQIILQNVASTITSQPKYGGQTMTLISTKVSVDKQFLYYLVNPPSGSNTFTVTKSESANWIATTLGSYTGVNQVNPLDVSASGDSNTASVTTLVDNDWAIAVDTSTTTTPTAGSGSTRRNVTFDNSAFFDSNGAKTPAGIFNMGFGEIGAWSMTSFSPYSDSPITKLEPQYLLANTSISNPISNYSESNQDDSVAIYGSNKGAGQSFQPTSAVNLTRSKFYLKKTGSPTGSVVSRIYLATGALGSNTPTGSALATSNGFDPSTLTSSYQLINFDFVAPVLLASGTNYVVTIEYVEGDVSNNVLVGEDTSSPTAPGNLSTFFSGSWSPNIFDIVFYTETQDITPPQTSMTLWDSSEWNTTNAYIHEVDAANGSASSATVIDSGSVVVTNSTVSSPDNVGYSSSLCMPSTGDLGFNFPTDNGDIAATRILVQVGGTEASCGPVVIPIYPSRLKIIKGFLYVQAGKLQIR